MAATKYRSGSQRAFTKARVTRILSKHKEFINCPPPPPEQLTFYKLHKCKRKSAFRSGFIFHSKGESYA
jgi:hypothetical protein